MKSLAVFFALVAVASATYPAVASWTHDELVVAINDPATDPAALPYLQTALEQTGNLQAPVTVSIPVSTTYTMEELAAIVHDPVTDPALLPYYEQAMSDLMIGFINEQQETITVEIPAMNVNMWTLPELSAALENPETDEELDIYLEHALNQLMSHIVAGEPIFSIAVVTPPGVPTTAPFTVEPVIIAPVPEVQPEPIVVAPSPAPVQPTPAIPEPVLPEDVSSAGEIESPALVPSRPLVQLIININAQQ